MHTSLIKLFLFFLFFLSSAYSGGAINQPLDRNDIKDTIVVHDMVLHGKIIKIGAERLSFRLQYSEGVSHFSYKDIKSITTKYNYHISYNRMDIEGKIVAIEDNKYLKVIEENGNQRTINISSIDNFVMSVVDDDSLKNRVRNKFPYTKGNISAGLKLEHGTTEKRTVDLQLNIKHKQAEHEVSLFLDYEYETRETETTPKYDYTDELVAILTYKNHFKTNQFYYGTLMADYDRPSHINHRYVPSVGYGYRFKFDKSAWLEPSLGLGYVTTTYTNNDYPDKDFLATAFVLKGKYRADNLIFLDTVIVDGFVMYYPSLEDPSADWLTRANLNFTVPLFEFVSVKLALGYVDDSNPDPTVGNNKQTTKLLFGINF